MYDKSRAAHQSNFINILQQKEKRRYINNKIYRLGKNLGRDMSNSLL